MKRITILLVVMLALTACDQSPRIYPIASIRMDSEIAGSFFLGCGTIGEMQYIFSWYNKGIGWKLLKVPYYEATIVMDEKEAPYFIFVPTNGMGRHDNYEFHVPPGTIISEYVLR